MKILKIILILIIFLFLTASVAVSKTVLAAQTCGTGTNTWQCENNEACGKSSGLCVPKIIGDIPAPPGVAQYEKTGASFGGFLSNVIVLFTVIAGIVAFYNLLIGGFQFITSAGNPKGIEEAWKKLVFSLIGLIIIVGAFIVANIVGNALGFNLLDLSLIKGPQ